MTEDLEETLAELGPGCRAAAERLLAGREVEPRRKYRFGSRGRCAAPVAVAASLAAMACAWFAFDATVRGGGADSPRRAGREYLLAEMRDDAALREIVRTQNPDGSWKNAFLTRRNAEALRLCGSPAARIAYKKAVRNLRGFR